MIYTLFVQKNHHDPAPFPLTALLHDFLCFTKADGVILCPGHLSKTAATAKAVMDVFLQGTMVNMVGFGNIYGKNALACYKAALAPGQLLDLECNGFHDHRKMVFLFRHQDPSRSLKKLNLANYLDFLDSIEMVGVAIGSSNCSYTTYGSLTVGGPSANKGEADVLMFEDSSYADRMKKLITDQVSPDYPAFSSQNMVLSESITPVAKDFLKDMLRQTLHDILA